MLPLWIIDLNRDENLQEEFRAKLMALPGTNENWRYTTYSDIDFDNEKWFANFVQELVSSGQRAIRELKELKPINDCCMNICVIGDATEEFTLKFFSSTAAIIKKEKRRIIPGHVHQGINILGMLFVPSDIHNAEFSKRQSVLRCLKELDIQHRVNLAAGYDKVMLYQDTQCRTAKFYPLLTPNQRMDYLFQCLIHLYYICDATHPLLDSNNTDDHFFYLGVGSLYYDTDEQDEKDLRLVGNEIFETIKEPALVDSKDHGISIFDVNQILATKLFDTLQISFQESPAMSNLGVTPPVKHPVNDFTDKHLLALFYRAYLKYYPSRVLDKIIENIADSTKSYLENINTAMKNYFTQVKNVLRDNVHNVMRHWISPEVGCLTMLKNKFVNLKEVVTRLRKTVDEVTEVELWAEIITKHVPKRLNDAFMDYHGRFLQDETNTGSSHCDEMKEEVTEKYTEMLRKEPTLLSTLTRSFLLGIILVLGLMPIIESLSPAVVNLGNVKDWSYIWASVIFIIPLIIEFIKFERRCSKKRKLVNKLVAFYLHDAYARLVNRAKNQLFDFYDKFASLCDEYEKRCKTNSDGGEVIDKKHIYRLEIPSSMFNQPIVEGSCGNIPLFADAEINMNLLNIHGSTVRADKVTKKQKYVLVQDFSEVFMKLFDGINVYETTYRDPSTREVVTMTDEQIAQAREENWELARADFQKEFVEQVKTIFIPRIDTTVSQKLRVLAKDPVNRGGFATFSSFCTPSGEFSANDDHEYADIKTNHMAVKDVFASHLPLYTTTCQVHEDPMYRSFMFMTKWKSFDYISPNRILPETELYDKDVFDVWNKPPKSSLILYALIGNMSAEWYELFTPRALADVPEACKVYKDEIERRK